MIFRFPVSAYSTLSALGGMVKLGECVNANALSVPNCGVTDPPRGTLMIDTPVLPISVFDASITVFMNLSKSVNSSELGVNSGIRPSRSLQLSVYGRDLGKLGSFNARASETARDISLNWIHGAL